MLFLYNVKDVLWNAAGDFLPPFILFDVRRGDCFERKTKEIISIL